MLKAFKQKLQLLIGSQIDPLRDELFVQNDGIRFSIGQLHARLQRPDNICCLHDAEFKVFSQAGEDGIIQYLTRVVPIAHRCFVEIGVENYWESNTRFLLMHNNWSGVIVDASDSHIRFLEASGLRWRHNIVPIKSFVTRENINELLRLAAVPQDMGLLSLDIDGMDYWVLEAMTAIKPRIMILEYNSRFGCELPVTVPYKADYSRRVAHHSCCYYGASLPALCALAASKGYAFVGASSSGVNAFFVRKDVMPSCLRELTAREGFVMASARESRGQDGRLLYLSAREERDLIRHLPVVNVLTQSIMMLGDVFEANDRINASV